MQYTIAECQTFEQAEQIVRALERSMSIQNMVIVDKSPRAHGAYGFVVVLMGTLTEATRTRAVVKRLHQEGLVPTFYSRV